MCRCYRCGTCNICKIASEIFAGIQYEGEYEDGFTKTAKLLRTALDKPQSNTLSETPSRNAPCPCCSGRKYKNC